MGSVIALRENCPIVPNTPNDHDALVNEVRQLTTELKVLDVLEGLRVGVDLASKIRKSKTYLLILDAEKRRTRVQGFDEVQLATDEYVKIEKDNVSNPTIQAVLVSVDSVAGLRSAYPSFYLDTTAFLNIVRETVG